MERNIIIKNEIKKYWNKIEDAYSKSPNDFRRAVSRYISANDIIWNVQDAYFEDIMQDFLDLDMYWYDFAENEQNEGVKKYYKILKEYIEV